MDYLQESLSLGNNRTLDLSQRVPKMPPKAMLSVTTSIDKPGWHGVCVPWGQAISGHAIYKFPYQLMPHIKGFVNVPRVFI